MSPTQPLVSSKGVKNLSVYSKKMSGGLLALAGLYIVIINL